MRFIARSVSWLPIILPLPVACLALPASGAGVTLIPSGGTVTLPSGANIGSTLQFGTGGADDATLEITGGGPQVFSGAWIVNASSPVFELAPGVTLVMQPSRQGSTLGSPSILQLTGGGTLVLGQNSYLTDWKGSLGVLDGGTLEIGDRRWLSSAPEISLGLDGQNTTLRYVDTSDASFSGMFGVGDLGGRTTIDVTSTSPTRFSGNLTLSGAVQGTSDLRILNSRGLLSPTVVTLDFGQGSYDGKLVLDGARVLLSNARGIGTDGLRVEHADSILTIGNSMTTDAAQVMELEKSLLIKGATGTQQLTWNGDIDTGTNTLSIESMQLSMAATSVLSGAGGAIELAKGGILSLNGATAAQKVLGNGGLLSGPGSINELGDAQGFNGTIQLGNGSVAGTLQVTGPGGAHMKGAFLESMLFPGTGTADKLVVTGVLDQFEQSSVDLIYNGAVAGGPLVPANGTSQDYTIVTGGALLNGTPALLALTTIDPLNNVYNIQQLDPSTTNANAAGVKFEWIATPGVAGSGVLRITGAVNPTITVPGSTQTNIGTVNNTQLTSAVNQISSITQQPSQPTDAQYVGSSLLLLTPQVLPGAVVTAAVPGNPDALPNTTFNSMSQAGQVARLRLMQLRDGDLGQAAARAGGNDGTGAAGSEDDSAYRNCSIVQDSGATGAISQPLALDAGINGASPQEGARAWARGYGFYENVNGQSYAQGDYSASMGGVMFGADATLDGGLLAGVFAGFTPGKMNVQSTMGETQTSLTGVNFGGYASWAPGDGSCYLQGYAMAGYNDANQSRQISIPGLERTATSTANVWGAMTGAEGGLNFRIGEGAVLQPYASLEYGYYTRGSYTESGAGSMNLSVSGQDANILQPMCGARAMKSFTIGRDVLTPYIGAAFVAQVPLGSWSETATNGFSGAQVFTYGEGADDQYGGSFQAGLEFATAVSWTAYISFNGMAMTDTTVYGGQVGINFTF